MKKIYCLFFILVLFSQAALAAKSEKVVIPDNSGYVGTLPDLESRFKKTEEEKSSSPYEFEDGFNDKYDIKPAPRNNPAFVDIILKKDKTSKYVNDLNELILILQQLETTIESKESLQIFNARAYFFKENAEYFREKYQNRAEASYASFKQVMDVNTHIQAISALRREKEVYSPYVTSDRNGNAFADNNINLQLDYLLDDIKSSIVLLKQAK